MNSPFNYKRRKSSCVSIGKIVIGGNNPIAIQSMTNTPTLDTEASSAQIERIADSGADIIRLTAQSVNHARNLANIKERVRKDGYDVPLVADIHFTPDAAFVAAGIVEKVRINPGNFVDPARTFKRLDNSDAEYAEELKKIEDKLVPLLSLCKENNVALRIGVNHGSLSDRIMSRYGNTAAGMTESAMEFLRICRAYDFDNVVISIKASNVNVMVETVLTLVKAMEKENMNYPLHLGVTEAGDGEDGRVKSAVGIGALLSQGIGDTIRVSLSEEPEAEIPVARQIIKHIERMVKASPLSGDVAPDYDAVSPKRRKVKAGILPVAFPVIGYDIAAKDIPEEAIVIAAETDNVPGEIKSRFHKLMIEGNSSPAIVKVSYPNTMDYDDIVIAAAIDFGSVLLAGFGEGIWIDAPHINQDKINSLALAILQAVRVRISKTEYIACPSCGRTLFDLPATLEQVRKATSHLSGLKIAVMGCIVNGPGEMADADYGYVGAGVGNVSLYKGKTCVAKNLSAADALPLLIQLIKDNGDWIDEPKEKR